MTINIYIVKEINSTSDRSRAFLSKRDANEYIEHQAYSGCGHFNDYEIEYYTAEGTPEND